jgi:CRP-like cAMP-binding protein
LTTDIAPSFIEGKLEVIAEDRCGSERLIVTLSTGDSFGEIALVENVPRTVTVRTITPATLLRLGKKDFDGYLAGSAESRGTFRGINDRPAIWCGRSTMRRRETQKAARSKAPGPTCCSNRPMILRLQEGMSNRRTVQAEPLGFSWIPLRFFSK